MNDYILAHDLGTTGNKATLFNIDGKLVAFTFSPYQTYYPQPGYAEHDPQDWWNAVCDSSRQLIDRCPEAKNRIAAVGLSGMMNGCLLTDRHGNPIGRSLIHADIRSAGECRILENQIGAARAYEISGNRLAPNFTLGKLAWLKSHEPALLYSAARCVQTKDYIGAKLTGVQGVTDFSDASLTGCFDLNENCWSDELIEAAGFSASLLPEVRRSTETLGFITAESAMACGLSIGTPVVIGGGDGACATAGGGAYSEGDAYHYLGGSSWVAVVTEGYKPDTTRRVSVFCGLEAGKFVLYGTVQSAGSSLDWFMKNIMNSMDASGTNAFDELEKLAGTAPAGSNGLFFLPYLMGERSPIWDANARGVYFGLSASHGRAEMARAVFEGVSYALAGNLKALHEAAQIKGNINALGGGMRSSFWRGMLAAIYGRPLQMMARLSEATSCGAAIAAAVGSGIYSTFVEAGNKFAPLADVIEVEEDLNHFYNIRQELFSSMYPVMSGLFGELEQLNGSNKTG